jgi:hypothetical protein
MLVMIRSLSFVLVCSLLLVCLMQYETSSQNSLPTFLKDGSFAEYEQEFSSGEIHKLRWEIASLNVSSFEISLQSHGLAYNTATKTFDITPGGGTLVVDRGSLEISDAYYPNGTEIAGYPIGERIAFWISGTVNETSLINSMYEKDRHPTLVGPLEFDCLSSARICWMTENVYSSGNWMNRYYDQETGIVLRIETYLRRDAAEISVLETLNSTNIAPLIEAAAGAYSLLVPYVAIIGFSIPILSVLALHHRRKRLLKNMELRSSEMADLAGSKSKTEISSESMTSISGDVLVSRLFYR